MLEFVPKNEKMMEVRFASLQSKLTMIVASAPTNEANNSKKDCFYYNLNDLVNYVAEHEILNICSDLNAKVGNSHRYAPEVIKWFWRH